MENKSIITKEILSIIVIEDNHGDYILVEDYLIEIFKNSTIKQYTTYKSVSDFLRDENCRCDLILLDLHLPDMQGMELIKNLITQSSKIPIIILTGYADLHLARKSLALGVYDFLVKDEITTTLLHKSIEFAISRSSYVNRIEIQNEQLKNIAWTQSHMVRAPLAKILGIIEILDTDTEDLSYCLEQLKKSTVELDDTVRKIVNDTQNRNKYE